MRRRSEPAVPEELVTRIEEALTAVDAARARLDEVLAHDADRLSRRAAHAHVRPAFDRADLLLRRATRAAERRSRGEWMRRRGRLSQLGTARQAHLFAERDDSGLLPIGSVRAVDTGMSGPAIGELQHGQSKPPGAPATYGLDLERALAGPQPPHQTAPPERMETDDDDPGRATPPARETPRADPGDLVLAAAG